jgi:hypothetical protein
MSDVVHARPSLQPLAWLGRVAPADAGMLHWLLRLACAAEFVGHGAFGIITKAVWVPYFGVVGIPPELAWKLMPIIGSVDIALGLLTLVRPMRGVLLYMAFWGFATATIRPLAGESIWEFVERVPNWAVPLAFFGLVSGAPSLRPGRLERLLRLAVAGALVGHGAYGAILGKPSWVDYLAVLGIPSASGGPLVVGIGAFEMALGLVALVAPVPAVLVFLTAWKMATELLRPLAGEPGWEFVERASNMLAPLALGYVRGGPASLARWFRL